MRISIKNFIAASVLGAGVTIAGTVHAGTITQTEAFTFEFAPSVALVMVSPGNTANTTNQNTLGFTGINNFNSALGSLNAVRFDIAWTGGVQNTWSNSSGFTSHTATFRSDINFSSGSAGNVLLDTAGQTTPPPPFTPIPLISTTTLEISGATSITSSDANLLALFSGPGTIASTIQLENFVELTVLSGGSVMAFTRGCPSICVGANGDPLTQVGGNLTVTYDFSETMAEIPAPGGIALFALGLIGIGAARRRAR